MTGQGWKYLEFGCNPTIFSRILFTYELVFRRHYSLDTALPAPVSSVHHNWTTGLVFLTGLILDMPHTSWGTSTHSSVGRRWGTILVMNRQLFWGSRSHSSLGLLTITALTWVSQTWHWKYAGHNFKFSWRKYANLWFLALPGGTELSGHLVTGRLRRILGHDPLLFCAFLHRPLITLLLSCSS